MDLILIADLELKSHIGITPEERSVAQRLTVSLEIEPRNSFVCLNDELSRTVDYFAVSRRLQEVSLKRPRNLIETLAQDIAAVVLGEFEVARVSIELKKYILPDTRYVAVKIARP